MNAPDKIYVHEISAEELTENLPYHVCYICKDALLEWANARKSGLASGESFVAGERKMLKEIIDKLNSM